MIKFCHKFITHPWFERFITAMIVLNAISLGLETYPALANSFGVIFNTITIMVIVIFVAEAVIKIIAVAPNFRKYFGNGWDLFDFMIVVVSLIPQSSEHAIIARTLRLFRILRLISVIPELRIVTTTIVRSLPGLGNVILLLLIVFYVYAIAGFYMFSEHDQFHWNSLGISLITLFRVLTLEDWTDIMYVAMEVYPMAWLYFLSFVVISAFIVINMFIAILINNLHKTNAEEQIELGSPMQEQIMTELRMSNERLVRIEAALQSSQQAESTQSDNPGLHESSSGEQGKP